MNAGGEYRYPVMDEIKASGTWISQETEGEPTGGTCHLTDASADVFLSTYVLDLLSEADVREALREARLLLRPDTGRLLLAA